MIDNHVVQEAGYALGLSGESRLALPCENAGLGKLGETLHLPK